MNNNPIGVFDSGIGGINVLKSLIEKFPNEDFIYVADTLNCPYGVKTPQEIKNLVDRITNYLINKKCKAIVIACNTATSCASHLFNLKEIPILGVIYPTANDALVDSKKIAILATDATINSGVYQEVLLNANREVFPVKCSVFVEPIEKGLMNTEYSYNLVRNHLNHLSDQNIDTVILGCTHFPLFSNEIKQVFPAARLVNSGIPTANKLYEILKSKDLLSNRSSGKIYLKTTLDEYSFNDQIKIFDLNYESIEKINI